MLAFVQSCRLTLTTVLQRFPWKAFFLIGLGLLIILWLANIPAGLLGKADAVGYAVCHRIESRSFHLGERPFSFCARCTGQYLGALLGLAYLALFRPRRAGRPAWAVIAVLGLLAVAYAVDGFNSYLHLIPLTGRFWLYEPSNQLRLFTGMGLGLGISVMLYPAFNQTIWRSLDPRPVLAGWRDFGGLLLLATGLAGLVLLENPLILFPLALLSAAGVLILLTLIYSMVWVLILRRENHYEQASQFLFPALAGFMVALLQIAALDFLRYLLTGTWSGFSLG